MLQDILPAQVFAYLLVFVRLGTMIMVLPALGEGSIPARVRLAIAVAVTMAIAPVVTSTLPALPSQPLGLFLALMTEIIIGIFVGGAARLIMSGLHVAGTVIAFQSGLAAAQNFDPSQGTQSALMGTFMILVGVLVIFTFNLHYLLLWAMRDSYSLFPPGQLASPGEFAELAVRSVSGAFALGIQISAPFLVYGIIFNVGLGLLSRLMPQLQVFFIAMPLNIAFAFFILMLVIGAGMTWFADYFETTMSAFLK